MNPYIWDCFSNSILSIKYEAQGKSPMTKCLLDTALMRIESFVSFSGKEVKCNSILKEIFFTGGPSRVGKSRKFQGVGV